jgi:hypothetical protein
VYASASRIAAHAGIFLLLLLRPLFFFFCLFPLLLLLLVDLSEMTAT